ncbi:hypothetical protein B0H13DRAFT_1714367 [Mycena leptocephala]|nr:hypothetical protein B0H13DRAFT_1714367 [Mycena leptocephala]
MAPSCSAGTQSLYILRNSTRCKHRSPAGLFLTPYVVGVPVTTEKCPQQATMANVLPIPVVPGIPKFDNTLGALLVGGLVATALWGVTCVQTFTFFMGGTADRGSQKALVCTLILDTFDTVLNCHILYYYLVTNYLVPEAIVFPVWSIIVHVAATSLSNFIVRRYILSLTIYLPLTSCVTACLHAVSISVLTIRRSRFTMKTFLDLVGLSNLMYLNFAAGTSSDLSVALALCYLLRGSRTGFQRTDSLIRVLMMYTVNTGLIVAIDATAGMFAFVFMPHNLIFLGFYLLLSKLYLNSYLAILNVRQNLRENLDEPKSIHLSRIQSTMRWRSGVVYDSEGQRSDSQPAIAVPKVCSSDAETFEDWRLF